MRGRDWGWVRDGEGGVGEGGVLAYLQRNMVKQMKVMQSTICQSRLACSTQTNHLMPESLTRRWSQVSKDRPPSEESSLQLT